MKKAVVVIVGVAVVAVVGYVIFSGGNDTPLPVAEKSFTVEVESLSDSQPLAPGVYVIHTGDFTFDYEGEIAPESFEPMAEIGSSQELGDFVKSQAGVLATHVQSEPILPGESASFTLDTETDEEIYISGVQMAVASNDGYALVDRLPLKDLPASQVAANYDNGTEENTELGSGFEGGQPDPSQGEANVENGTSTDPTEAVKVHEQLTFPVMEVTVK